MDGDFMEIICDAYLVDFRTRKATLVDFLPTKFKHLRALKTHLEEFAKCFKFIEIHFWDKPTQYISPTVLDESTNAKEPLTIGNRFFGCVRETATNKLIPIVFYKIKEIKNIEVQEEYNYIFDCLDYEPHRYKNYLNIYNWYADLLGYPKREELDFDPFETYFPKDFKLERETNNDEADD